MSRAVGAAGVGAALAAATLFTTWGLLFYRPLPTVDGYYRLLGLHERGEVIRDVFGIPRIYARDLHDLFFLQGYVTAQDRLGQMETLRGELVPPSVALELERAVASGPASVRQALDAYAAGVNRFIDQHRGARALPGELVLEGRTIPRWTRRDSLVILAGHLPGMNTRSRCIALSADLTLKGRPMLAADVYIDELRPRENAPSAGWYEIGLDGGGARAIGASLPGVPGIAVGHNAWVAWSISPTRRSVDAVSSLGAMLSALHARRLADAEVALGCAVDVHGARRGDDVAFATRRALDVESLRAALGRPPHPVGVRIVVDLADVDTSRSVVSHGASAHRSSPHYGDQRPLWEIGQTHRLPFTRGAIGRTDGELVLRAR